MKFGVYILFLVSLLSCTGFYHERITELSPAEFQDKITGEADAQLIDVRTPAEFEEGAIRGAQNMNLNADDFQERIVMLDKEKPVYVYCRSGIRSKDASYLLAEKGYKVYVLQGGYINWQKLPGK